MQPRKSPSMVRVTKHARCSRNFAGSAGSSFGPSRPVTAAVTLFRANVKRIRRSSGVNCELPGFGNGFRASRLVKAIAA